MDIEVKGKTLVLGDTVVMRYETKKHNKVWQVVRVWYDGWFPDTPVTGMDFRGHNREAS